MMRTSNISSFYHQTEILYFSTAGKVKIKSQAEIKSIHWIKTKYESILGAKCLIVTTVEAKNVFIKYFVCAEHFENIWHVSSGVGCCCWIQRKEHLSLFVPPVTQAKRLWCSIGARWWSVETWSIPFGNLLKAKQDKAI